MVAITRKQDPLVILLLKKWHKGQLSHTGNVYYSLSHIQTMAQQFYEVYTNGNISSIDKRVRMIIAVGFAIAPNWKPFRR